MQHNALLQSKQENQKRKQLNSAIKHTNRKEKMEFETEIEKAKVSIHFDYQPEEPMVRYYSDGTGYTGCAASIDNVSAYWQTRKFNSENLKFEDVEIDITDLLDELGYDVEQLCWDYLSNLEK